MKRASRKGRPNHAVEFKRELAKAACEAGVSVAKLALEHRINANLLFKWRRHYRAGKFGEPGKRPTEADPAGTGSTVAMTQPVATFQLLPVVESVRGVRDETVPTRAEGGCIEVIFACATVRIHGAAEPTVLRAVLDCLARRR